MRARARAGVCVCVGGVGVAAQPDPLELLYDEAPAVRPVLGVALEQRCDERLGPHPRHAQPCQLLVLDRVGPVDLN